MNTDSLAGVILAALGVCVLAVVVALLLPQVLSSAPVLEMRQWFDSLRLRPILALAGNLRTRTANTTLPHRLHGEGARSS